MITPEQLAEVEARLAALETKIEEIKRLETVTPEFNCMAGRNWTYQMGFERALVMATDVLEEE